MKINDKKLRSLIRQSLITEITQLATGATNFETTRYEQCATITIPKIFRDLYLDKIYGETPDEMRTNLQRKYSELTVDKQKAVMFATVFSDENIGAIMELLTQFANVAGIPAMFCKFLQRAIDLAAEMIDVLGYLSEEEDESKFEDPSGMYKNAVRDAFNFACDQNFSGDVDIGGTVHAQTDIDDKLKITPNETQISNQAYRTTFIACFPNTFNALMQGIGTNGFNKAPLASTDYVTNANLLYDSYAQDILMWQKVLQNLDNLNTIADTNNIDDPPLEIEQVHELLINSIDNTMSVSPSSPFNDSNFRDYLLGSANTFLQELNRNQKLFDFQQKKLNVLGNRQRNIQNLKFKDLFISVIKGFVNAQQNYLLFDLPRLHGDISSLGKKNFYEEAEVKKTILQIYTSTQK